MKVLYSQREVYQNKHLLACGSFSKALFSLPQTILVNPNWQEISLAGAQSLSEMRVPEETRVNTQAVIDYM